MRMEIDVCDTDRCMRICTHVFTLTLSSSSYYSLTLHTLHWHLSMAFYSLIYPLRLILLCLLPYICRELNELGFNVYKCTLV